MRLILFVLAYFLSVNVHACDTFNTVCKTICAQDGDDLGIVLNKKCYCANYRNVDDVFTKVPKHGRAIITEQKQKSFWDN